LIDEGPIRIVIRVAGVELHAHHAVEPLVILLDERKGAGEHRVAHAAVAAEVAIDCHVRHAQLHTPAVGDPEADLGDHLKNRCRSLADGIAECHACIVPVLIFRRGGIGERGDLADRSGGAHTGIAAALGVGMGRVHCRADQKEQ
jgi:hypothetical protein